MQLDFVHRVNEFLKVFPASWDGGDRTVTRNMLVGGAKKSYHLLGLAIDLIYDSPEELWRAAKAATLAPWFFGGVEVDLTNNHLHLDGRPNSKPWHVVKTLEKEYINLQEYLTSHSSLI